MVHKKEEEIKNNLYFLPKAFVLAKAELALGGMEGALIYSTPNVIVSD